MSTTKASPVKRVPLDKVKTPAKKVASPKTVAAEQPTPEKAEKAAERAVERDRAKRREKVQEHAKEMRLVHWPKVKEKELWILDGKRGGFAQVPRTLSMITNIIKEAVKTKTGKSSSAGNTYIVLWLHTYGQGLSKIDSEAEVAFEAGYGGERSKTTFRNHIKTLEDLGFIAHAAGPRGPYQWILLFNPYQVLKRLHKEKLVSDTQYGAVLERSNAIGSGHELTGGEDEN